MPAKPYGEVEHDTHNGGSDGRQTTGEDLFSAEGFDIGCAQKDKKEARDEGDPSSHYCACSGHEKGAERLGAIPAAKEADKLKHEYKGARGSLGETEAIKHLRSSEPAVIFYGLLGNIGEDGVGTAEGNDRGLGEKDTLRKQDVIRAKSEQSNHDGSSPNGEPEEDGFCNFRGVWALDGVEVGFIRLFPAVTLYDEEPLFKIAATDQTKGQRT